MVAVAFLTVILIALFAFGFLGIWAKKVRNSSEKNQRDASQFLRALQESQDKFKLVVESNFVGIFFYKHDGTITNVNNAFLELLGYSRVDVERKSLNWKELTPSDWKPVDHKNLDEVRTTNRFVGFEKEFFHKNGSRIPVFISAADFSPDSTEGVAFVIDLTAQKSAQKALDTAEQRNRLATALGGVGTWEWSFETSKLNLSDISWKLFGFEGEPHELGMEEIMAVILPEDQEELVKNGDSVVQSGKDWAFEFRVRHKDGAIRWLALRGRALKEPNGGPPKHCVGVHFDITREKTAEENLRASEMRMEKAMHEAQAANQMKDEFLATLSHELRTPLNAILGWSELMQTADRQSELFNRAIETIQRNARLQCEMINDLLDMARILNGKFSIALKEIDLGNIMMDAIESCRLSAQVKQIDVHVDLDLEDAQVVGDPNRLQQIIWNLLNNAIKFTPRGGTVKISATREGTFALVKVDDSGEGIPAEFLPFVFDRFRQADASTARRHGGLGLGLAIVRHLVELHGGSVLAESLGAGKGSSFQIRLPITPVETMASDLNHLIHRQTEESIEERTKHLLGKRILIVDDVKDSLEYVGQVLSMAGSVITLANSGPEAIAQIEAGSFDLVLTDLGMPVIDGFKLLEALRAHEAKLGLEKTPAIALTAYARESDFAKTREAGFDAHLAKPVSPAKLYKMLTDVFTQCQPDDFETIRNISTTRDRSPDLN